MLPQVLAGLGAISFLSAGCLLWLERLQPVFFSVALASLVHQVWLVWRSAPDRRTRGMKLTLAASLFVNAVMIAGWIFLSIRYA